jgi:hypothetical protein
LATPVRTEPRRRQVPHRSRLAGRSRSSQACFSATTHPPGESNRPSPLNHRPGIGLLTARMPAMQFSAAPRSPVRLPSTSRSSNGGNWHRWRIPSGAPDRIRTCDLCFGGQRSSKRAAVSGLALSGAYKALTLPRKSSRVSTKRPQTRSHPSVISTQFWSWRRDSNPRPQPCRGCGSVAALVASVRSKTFPEHPHELANRVALGRIAE